MSTPLSFLETNRALEAFLEVAIHALLYTRNVYPTNIFKQHHKYNIPVWQSRSPLVNEYVSKMCRCVGEELDKVRLARLHWTLRKIIVVIKDDGPAETPFERFVFDVEWLIHDDMLGKDARDFIPAAGGITRTEMDETLRGFIVRVEAAKNYLPKLPKNVTFSVVLEMRDDVEPQSLQAKRGIEPSEWYRAEARHSAEEAQGLVSRLVPHQTTNLGMVQVSPEFPKRAVSACLNEKLLSPFKVQFLAEVLEKDPLASFESGEAETSTNESNEAPRRNRDEDEQERRRREKGKARAE
ncbi:BZ3500_MvSof-1268-A1-R1_Chr7-1g09135 [Microbotryum saponariae]|uniref:BZ3500_MvSof-1268-A1-R1_Chr7-1g09135 protein n=1 Tax=Microbotryum saponariae TaxID=289078 RepID=A0A2X0LB27_9BASI|nr:BZ3501_MvSof-1269-A2-R1_Chr7-1g08840 [Microbotryum saponariae]SDA02869.1 BZ3500_MvSof-1268-A1-R1_Chr7-1g09135 [Microbotryum saponariae]